MTAVAGKTQPFAVVGDDFDCHWVVFLKIRTTKKPVGKDGRSVDGLWLGRGTRNLALFVKLETGLLR